MRNIDFYYPRLLGFYVPFSLPLCYREFLCAVYVPQRALLMGFSSWSYRRLCQLFAERYKIVSYAQI